MESRMILGLPVIALETGRLMGKVQALAVDTDEKKVNALILGEKVFLRTKSLAVYFNRLRSLGSDAITISSEGDVVELASQPGLEKMLENSFLHQKAISEKGNLIGTIEGFTFDPTSGVLHGLLVKGGYASSLPDGTGFLPRRAISNFGRDFVICQDKAGELIEAHTGSGFREPQEEPQGEQAYRYRVKGKNLEEFLPAAQAKAREVGHSLEVRAVEFALGKDAGFTLTAPDGSALVNKGEKITQEIMDRAREQKRLYQLLFSAGVGELLEGIDYTAEKLDEGSKRMMEAWEHYRRSRQEENESDGENPEQKDGDEEDGEAHDTFSANSLAELEARLEKRWHKWEEKISQLIENLGDNRK